MDIPPIERKAVSIMDVARAADVSPTTVSHVISGKRPVSAETAARVQRSMSDLGYVPSRAAQSLSSGLNRTIGLLVPDIRNSFFADLARGVEDGALERGFSVLLGNTDFDHAREQSYLDVIRSRAIDGLVYAAGAPPAVQFLNSIETEIPIVLADEEVPGFRSMSVMCDHFEGGRLVGTHLSSLGHSRVLVVTGPVDLPSSSKRLAGFEAGFEGDSFEVCAGGFREEGGFEAILAQSGYRQFPFTAVFALNDLMAVGAIRGLDALGLRVPEDITVVGYDDIPLARLMAPPLTTVAQPAYEIGITSVGQLLQAIESQRPLHPANHVLEVELVIRGTDALAAGSEAGVA